MRQVVLIRGINIAGNNRVPMAELRVALEGLGCSEVSTHLASGNALVTSDRPPSGLALALERSLRSTFGIDDPAVKVLVLDAAAFRAVIADRPEGFGDHPDKFYSDAIFLMGGITVAEVMALADPREGVDAVWPGKDVVYWQRLTAQRTKTRLSKLMSGPEYKSMTVRSWSTTLKLAELL